MANKNKNIRGEMNGFTLVELLAVIVILAIILVIAVPKVMSVIEDAKKATLESTAKMIASQAEKQKVQNQVLGNDKAITCEGITNINDVDYASCDITFDENTAKVTITGAGKFEGLFVCNGTKTNATAGNTSCLGACGKDEIQKVYYEYEVNDIPSCVSYISTRLNAVGVTDLAAAVEPVCNGQEVNGFDFVDAINMVINEGIFTEEELVEANVLKIEEIKECVSKFSFEYANWETIVSNVKSGNHPYKVGETKTIDMGNLGTHTIRVANTTKCSEVTVESQTACGFVLEFADIITTHAMNDTLTNAGGWPASEMRTYVSSTIYNALPEELRNGIINTYVVSSYGPDKTTGVVENENAGVLASELYWSNDKLYLLSPQEVYGTSFTSEYDKSNGTSRQLDYYEDNNVTTSSYRLAFKNNSSGSEDEDFWWFRSADSITNNNFYGMDSYGLVISDDSDRSYGVSPAFRLSN